MPVDFELNGKPASLETDPAMPLLWALRDLLSLTGTKFGCGIAACGACTVLLEGAPVRSCVLPLAAVAGKRLTTIEGLAATRYAALQAAWIEEQVPQCGYCQSGMLMAAAGLLAQTPAPSDTEIDTTMSNLCRCGTYQRVRAAIHRTAKALSGR